MTFLEALNHSDAARELINQIDDCLDSWDGRRRYDSILRNMQSELEAMTGYRYSID